MTNYDQLEIMELEEEVRQLKIQLKVLYEAYTTILKENEIYFNRTNELNSPDNVASITDHINQIMKYDKSSQSINLV